MSEGRCKTCRHWESKPDHEKPVEVRRCLAVPMWENATKWNDASWGDDSLPDRVLKPEYAERLAFAQDGSSYYACLFTRAEFGCVQWEKGDE